MCGALIVMVSAQAIVKPFVDHQLNIGEMIGLCVNAAFMMIGMVVHVSGHKILVSTHKIRTTLSLL